ncbi:hypothetical protein VL06_02115 [Rossellomorea marisflavi]|nr:hypothetical protein VL06_02115 [Rossellomorea marisflavi]
MKLPIKQTRSRTLTLLFSQKAKKAHSSRPQETMMDKFDSPRIAEDVFYPPHLNYSIGILIHFTIRIRNFNQIYKSNKQKKGVPI